MAFNSAKKGTKNPNQFTARITSVKTGATIAFINITDTYARTVFGCEIKDISAEQALITLSKIVGNEFVELTVTDLTAEVEVVDPTDY